MAETQTPDGVVSSDTIHHEIDLPILQDTSTSQSANRTVSTSETTLLQASVDRVLNFLSTASNETLGACLVGLGASTYLLLGRVGLVIIGVAGGVVLQATWDGSRRGKQDDDTLKAELNKRREAGIDVVQRLLQWRAEISSKDDHGDTKIYASQAVDYSGKFGPETTAALDTFTDHVIKDYVHYWYDPAVPDEESFPAACRRVFTAFVLSLSSHLSRKRPADAFLDFVTNSSSIIIVFLSELAAALNASPYSSAEDAISAYLKAKPDSSLSYMINEESQKRKLADAAEDVLQAYLDPKAYNCAPVHVFLKEVFAQLVLGATVTLCSRPEWINDWIVYGLEESETTKEVMNIVDAGVEGGRRKQAASAVVSNPIKQEPIVTTTAETKDPMIVEHKRTVSKAEEAMDEAMREAQRLTALMIAEDERRAKEEQEEQAKIDAVEDLPEEMKQDRPSLAPIETEPETTIDDVQHNVSNGAEVATPADTTPAQFTDFDQLYPRETSQASSSPERSRAETPQLTLVQANISIFDDSVPGERTSIKAKPTTDYLIQIEPASSAFPGWMIARKYADFEILHEVLRRISVITGVNFTQAHAELPKWKVHTKASLRTELERYLSDALQHQPLAESEGMKRFLEKERGFTKSPGGGIKGFGWPTPDAFGKLGGDMINVLAKAPKQVAGGVSGGGKAVLGLVGANKKPGISPSNVNRSVTSLNGDALTSPTTKARPLSGHVVTAESAIGSSASARASQDSLSSFSPQSRGRRESVATTISTESKLKTEAASTRPTSMLSSSENGSAVISDPSPESPNGHSTPRTSLEEIMHLPPPPSEMPEDYGVTDQSGRTSIEQSRSALPNTAEVEARAPALPARPNGHTSPPKVEPKSKEPLTERETSVAIELMFAVIVELYTLSSAWQIRRTLLTAAKSFLLRPGNPQLLSVRDLLQTSLLDDNLSDAGLAVQIRKLRENGLPTTEELEIWYRDYPEKTADEKEALRRKARRLLTTKGMPQALTSVMGAAASGEALGKVFDCLQIPSVSRGLIFGLMLQALRVVTH